MFFYDFFFALNIFFISEICIKYQMYITRKLNSILLMNRSDFI